MSKQVTVNGTERTKAERANMIRDLKPLIAVIIAAKDAMVQAEKKAGMAIADVAKQFPELLKGTMGSSKVETLGNIQTVLQSTMSNLVDCQLEKPTAMAAEKQIDEPKAPKAPKAKAGRCCAKTAKGTTCKRQAVERGMCKQHCKTIVEASAARFKPEAAKPKKAPKAPKAPAIAAERVQTQQLIREPNSVPTPQEKVLNERKANALRKLAELDVATLEMLLDIAKK